MSTRSLTWAALALLVTCVAGTAAEQRREGPLISVDLASSPLDRALKMVFETQGGQYTFTMPTGMNLPLTVSLHNVSLDQAVTALLDLYGHAHQVGLTYHRNGSVYVISETGEEPESEDSLGPKLTLEFNATPLGDALKVIFARTPYTFRLDDPGLTDLIVTMRFKDMLWLWALEKALDQYSLTYDQEGSLYRISPLSSEQVASTQQKLGADKHAMLYVTDRGDELRHRVFPYPGSERVVWPGAEDLSLWYYLPSPSFDYVALFVGRFPTRVFVQELATRRTREVAKGMHVEYGLWQGENSLHLLSTDRDGTQSTESVYDPQTHQMTSVRTYPRETESQLVAFLSAPFAKQIEELNS